MSRVPIRDFDHDDQTLMLPEAVRTLAILLALKNRVYVHCTAGINRATLTTLGYFTFVEVRLYPERSRIVYLQGLCFIDINMDYCAQGVGIWFFSTTASKQ